MGLFKDCGCGCDGKKQEQKLSISVMSGLLFFIVANPDTFRLVRAVFGSWVAGPNGCPTMAGLVLHTIVFTLVAWGMMNIKREAYTPQDMVSDSGVSGPSPMVSGPAPRMVDAPSPLPGMTEDTFDFSDSGVMFSPLDIHSDLDLPGAAVRQSTAEAVTCACTDGRKVVITP